MTIRQILILLLLVSACGTSPTHRKLVVGRVYRDGQQTMVVKRPTKHGTFIYYHYEVYPTGNSGWIPYADNYTPPILTPTDTYVEETPSGVGGDIGSDPPPGTPVVDAQTTWTEDIGSDVDGGFDGGFGDGADSGGDSGGGDGGGGDGGD